MEATISKEIGLGDAGTPFHLIVDVTYEQSDNVITVIECLERECPYDNPSENWYRRIKEIVDYYFYDIDHNLTVKFQ